MRIDKWLWFARFFKTRTLSGKIVSTGKVRVNGVKISKPSAAIRSGDVLTFAQAREIRTVKVQALGTRRGPANEAQLLYQDLTEAAASKGSTGETPPALRKGARPTKKEGRDLRAFRRSALD